jgi:hypothetical protein
VNSHDIAIASGPRGSVAGCSCGWRSRLHLILRGWMAGARQVERHAAAWEARQHVRETQT